MDFHDYTELVFKIVGAAINVQKELNWGLHENIYNEALYYELLDCGIQNEIHKYLPCFYKCILLDKNMDPVRRFKSINPITTTKTIKGQQIKY